MQFDERAQRGDSFIAERMRHHGNAVQHNLAEREGRRLHPEGKRHVFTVSSKCAGGVDYVVELVL